MKVKVNGVELYYEIHGQGDWLVLSHEFSGGYKSWQLQVNAFQADHRVLLHPFGLLNGQWQRLDEGDQEAAHPATAYLVQARSASCTQRAI